MSVVQQLLMCYPPPAPTLAPASINYPEDRAVGETLGTVPTSGTPAVDFRFSATGTQTSSDGYFDIDSSGHITMTSSGASSAANDYETGSNSFTHDLEAKNVAGIWSSAATITLNVLDINANAGWQGKSRGAFTNDNTTWTATSVGSGTTSYACGAASPSAANIHGRKVYCEFQFVQRPGNMRGAIGVAISAGSFVTANTWTFFSSAAVSTTSGVPPKGYSDSGSLTSDNTYDWGTSDRIGLAVDASTSSRVMWISKNGVWLNGDPATNTGGFSFSAVAGAIFFLTSYHTTDSSGDEQVQMYPNAATQLYSAPSGFSVYA